MVTLLIMVTVSAQPVSAQQATEQPTDGDICARLLERTPPSVDRAFTLKVLRRDLDVLSEELMLDEAQRVIMDSIYQDYVYAFDAGALATRTQMSELRPVSSAQDLARQQRERHTARQRMLTEVREEISQLEKDGELSAEQRQQIIQNALQSFNESFGASSTPDTAEARTQILTFLSQLNAITTGWSSAQSELEARFFSNVQAILSADQHDRWPGALRRVRRLNTISRGELSGEYVDLYTVLTQVSIDVSNTPSLEGQLTLYDAELDAALVARNAFLDQAGSLMFAALEECDLNAAMRVIDREMQLRVAVRDATDRHAEAIVGLLTGRQAAQFEEAWGRRAYPRVYNPTRAARLFTSAMGLVDLDSVTRSALLEHFQRYDGEMTSYRDTLVETIRREQPMIARRDFEQRIAELRGERLDSPANQITVALRGRLDVEQTYTAELAELLGNDHFQTLMSREMISTGPGRSATPVRQSANENRQERSAMFRTYDLDGNGQLDEKEVEAMRKALEAQAAGGG